MLIVALSCYFSCESYCKLNTLCLSERIRQTLFVERGVADSMVNLYAFEPATATNPGLIEYTLSININGWYNQVVWRDTEGTRLSRQR